MWMPTVTGAVPSPCTRQRIVNLGGGRVVDRERLHGASGSSSDGGASSAGKPCALGKVLKQEAPPVELVGRINRPRALQQVQRCEVRGARGLDHGLVFGRVFVGLEQDFVELLAMAAGHWPADSSATQASICS
jgi:hypothetical protein